MLKGDNRNIRNIRVLSEPAMRGVKDFLKTKIDVWCGDKGYTPFRAVHLIGGSESFWGIDHPLRCLYDHYRNVYERRYGDSGNEEAKDKYAHRQAGISAGHILKKVLLDDKIRTFFTESKYTRQYHLMK